jgi:ubiquinone biosynthesis protein
MERVTGTPLGSAEAVLSAMGPTRRREIATALLETVLDGVLDHGLFHVDLHPGNVLVERDGSLVLLDLGSVGRIDTTTRRAIGALLAALGAGDSLAATDALLELVDRPERVDDRELERDLGGLTVRLAAGGVDGATVFGALFRLVRRHRLAVPPQVAAMFRTFANLEGDLALIDPAFDVVAGARDAASARMITALDPTRIRASVTDELVTLLPLLRRLPRRLDRIADAVEEGRLHVDIGVFGDPRNRRTATRLLHQTLLTVLGSVSGLMAVLFLNMTDGPEVTEFVRLYEIFGYGLLSVAFILVLRVLVAIFRGERG